MSLQLLHPEGVLGAIVLSLAIALVPVLGSLRPAMQRLVLLLASTGIGLAVIELLIAFGLFDAKRGWVPYRWIAYSRVTLAEADARAAHHPFLFNDYHVEQTKRAGTFRIAVLGDSFVWGEGLPHEARWTRQFERRLRTADRSIEVLHWGRRGWSTRTQTDFLEYVKNTWSVDLLILAFVRNDPEAPDAAQPRFVFGFGRSGDPFRALELFAPNTSLFLGRMTTRVIHESFPSLSFQHYEDAMYQPENLSRWSATISELSKASASYGIPMMVLLTPADTTDDEQQVHAVAERIFSENRLPTLDLLPSARARFGTKTSLELGVHPGDPHPGTQLSAAIAELTVQCLCDESCSEFARRESIAQTLEKLRTLCSRLRNEKPPIRESPIR